MSISFAQRDKHFEKYLEFNKINEPIIDMHKLVDLAKIKSIELSLQNKNIRILELGTKRSNLDSPTNRKYLFNSIPNMEYIMTDYDNGLDVDIVCDLHKSNEIFNDNYFDIIISCSTFEHLKYPQLCGHNLMKMLTIKGILFIQTHQTFPLHGYKYDYYRFSREALKSIFNTKMNMVTLSSYFNQDCIIIPRDTMVWNHYAESYLNVTYVGEKIHETPIEYIYDIENT
jgi:hypothetical protein